MSLLLLFVGVGRSTARTSSGGRPSEAARAHRKRALAALAAEEARQEALRERKQREIRDIVDDAGGDPGGAIVLLLLS